MPLDNLRKVQEAEAFKGVGEAADGIPIARFQVYDEGRWKWAQFLSETSARGVRVQRLVTIGDVL